MTAGLVRNKTWTDVGRLKGVLASMDAVVGEEMKRRMLREVLSPLAVKVVAAGKSNEAKRTAEGSMSHSARASQTVKALAGATPKIRGGGRTKAGVLFYGSEFGGGTKQYGGMSGRTSTYATRYGMVTRHTTRQFRPYKGKKGYWFVPTIMANVDDAGEKLADIGFDAIKRTVG